ncbi:MAG: hypothetical protein K9M99_07405 [Candidatus Cloacimonetes bacterium]|nr:hypothetical protein [Candidatus Cloacimonadota bacterium]
MKLTKYENAKMRRDRMRVVCIDNSGLSAFSGIFSRSLAALAVKRDIELNYNGGNDED